MSDTPQPPGAPPPPPSPTGAPPPPPGLTPPPGYTPYAPSLMGSVPLQRVGGLAKAIKILVPIAGALALLGALLAGAALQEAEDYLADPSDVLEDDFLEAYSPAVLVGLAQTAATIAVAVLTMIWMYRLASNHRHIGRNGRWAPGFAIGGWFLPPFVIYAIPFLMFRELWKASDPDVPAGDQRWKSSRVHPVVLVWWLLYGIVPLAIAIAQGVSSLSSGFSANDSETLAETLDEQYPLTLAAGVVTLAAAIAYFVLVRGLTDRHQRLTGEAHAPR